MTTEIDLMPFCYPDGDARYAIREPFVRKGVKYATDGRMLVAVPSPDEPNSPDQSPTGSRIKYPNCAEIFVGFDTVKSWHEFPSPSSCRECNGVGRLECPKCHGHGQHKCTCGCEHECEWCDEKDNMAVCKCNLPFGKYRVATWIANRTRVLPNVRWGIPIDHKQPGIIFLQFDGGYGAMMPLDTEDAK